MVDIGDPESAKRGLTASPEAQTRHWLEQIVLGLNLCPFAGPVLKANTVYFSCCDSVTVDGIAAAILIELDRLQGSQEEDIATTLLIFSAALADFNAFWDAAALASELLEEAGLEGVIQIATFHPDYCFEGSAPDDVENYSNRSPYPMLHFIREAHLTRVLQDYPAAAEEIPENNITRLRQLGLAAVQQLVAS